MEVVNTISFPFLCFSVVEGKVKMDNNTLGGNLWKGIKNIFEKGIFFAWLLVPALFVFYLHSRERKELLFVYFSRMGVNYTKKEISFRFENTSIIYEAKYVNYRRSFAYFSTDRK